MKKKILTLASALTFASLLGFNAYADMDLETNNAVSGIAVALNNYKASSISPQKALGESLKAATTKTIEINGAEDARTKLLNEVVKYEAPTIQDKLKENIAVGNAKKETTVHASADDKGKAVGNITYSSVATVLETVVNENGEWYRIKSGNVNGYVRSSEVATGEEAKKLVDKSAVTYGTVVDIDNVRLRTKPKVTSETLTMLEGGEKYVVVGHDNDFVKVQVDDDLIGYVYKDFLKTDISYKTAKTIDEATIEALEKEKLKKEADDAMTAYENLVIADTDAGLSTVKNAYSIVDETSKETAAKKKEETSAVISREVTVGKSAGGNKKAAEKSTETVASRKAKEETAGVVKITEASETTKKTVEKSQGPKATEAEEETAAKVIEITTTVEETGKASETTKVPEITKVIEESTKAPETAATVEETGKTSETTKVPEITKVIEESTKAPETAVTVEETGKASETAKASEITKVIEETTTKAAETAKDTESSVEIRAYGPGGSSEKPKEKAKKSTTESSVVTGVNGGPGVSKSKAETEATKAAVEKASRSAIVAYAKQYVGNPYVFGGTSLTNGADCSGFLMKVYEHFGISTGRNTKQQAKKGREIPISDVEPGDFIFYASSGEITHVAMYIGNGKIVHAANSKSGIIISSQNYRTPVKAVTFLN